MFKRIEQTNELKPLTKYLQTVKNMISATAAAGVVVKEDKIIYEWYDGVHSHTNQRKVDEHSLFNVGSIRKTYLGLIVSIAVHEGKIKSIDDLVSDYYDEMDRILLDKTTIRHLLTHAHGLNDKERMFPPGTK